MKKRIAALLLAAVTASALLAGCGTSNKSLQDTREVSFEGTELTVTLGANKSTGYEWSFEIDGDCIHQSINKSFTIKPVDGQATGLSHIGFEGLSEGSAVITLTTSNGWDGTGSGDTYTVDVTVNADGTIASASGQ